MRSLGEESVGNGCKEKRGEERGVLIPIAYGGPVIRSNDRSNRLYGRCWPQSKTKGISYLPDREGRKEL